MSQQIRLPDELEITGRTASYTYRTPGKYLLKIPVGMEVRANCKAHKAVVAVQGILVEVSREKVRDVSSLAVLEDWASTKRPNG